ncbi:hypothetical protein [Dankookia sp. P2]|uniref:hypothetical protein n=1 Tax=Dankookia sp. P2 TaxID=3423955 RepID=UPI003D668C42
MDADPADHRVAASHVHRIELGLQAPGAPHLATCARLGLPLLTFDQRRRGSAGAGADSWRDGRLTGLLSPPAFRLPPPAVEASA